MLFVVSRLIVQKAVLADLPPKDTNVVVSMLPRGLAAAVLATMPLSSGIAIPDFQQIVFVVILLSNIAATIGIFLFDRETKARFKPKPEESLEEAIEEADSLIEDTRGEGEAGDAGKDSSRPPAP